MGRSRGRRAPDPDTSNGKAKRALADCLHELVANGSIEMSIGDDAEIAKAAHSLPSGISVFVPSPPHRDLVSNLEHVRVLHEAGMDPVPHLAARKIRSREELRQFLETATKRYGVQRALIVGGDPTEPAGPYADSAALLDEGIIEGSGIREISIAGYPEGHPRIPTERLRQDLEYKVTTARQRGLGLRIVTQFSFSTVRILEYCAQLAHSVPEVPVYVGLSGPTSPRKLIRYARYCGVSTSLLALGSMGLKAASLVTRTDPADQLQALAHHCSTRPNNNIIGVHLFSFGGFEETARWMQGKCRNHWD
jgi:methylenetetrahydrofolate reductase (NADPH)